MERRHDMGAFAGGGPDCRWRVPARCTALSRRSSNYGSFYQLKPCLEGPYMRNPVILLSILGSPDFGNYQIIANLRVELI